MKNIQTESIQRILLTRIDRIGDVVLTTPAIEAVRQKFPKAHIAMLVAKGNQRLVQGNPFLNEVLIYDKDKDQRSWWKTLLYGLKLRQHHFDLVVHFHSTNRMLWVSWLAHIPIRIGWDRRLAWALTHPFVEHKREGKRHEAEYNFELLEPLEIKILPDLHKHVHLHQSQEDKQSLIAKSPFHGQKPYAAFHVGASCPSRIWPAENFAKVASQLHHRHGFNIVLTGGGDCIASAKKVQSHLDFPCFDLTGKLSLGETISLLADAKLMVGNDSGPAHMGAALKCPVMSIFSRNDPGLSPTRWKPLGPGGFFIRKDVGCEVCLAHDCQIDFFCLTEISPEETYDMIRDKMLSAQKQPSDS